MKTFSLIILLFISGTLLPQEKCKLVLDENSGKQMLIGEITRDAFRDTSFAGGLIPNMILIIRIS